MQASWIRRTMGAVLLGCVATSGSANAGEEPLPPLGTPVAQIVDELAWRSAQGDPEAACRLAMELAVCAVDLDRSRSLCQDREGNPAGCGGHHGRTGNDREVDWPRYVSDLEVRCEGAPVVTARELLAKFRRAAFLGSVTAMRSYLAAPAWMKGRPTARERSIWPEGADEARAVAQHVPTLRWALFHGGDAEIARGLASEEFSRAIQEWDQFPEDGGPRSHHIQAMALVRYLIEVNEALGDPGERMWPASNVYAVRLEMLAREMTTEHIEQAEAMAREWRETIPLLPDQWPNFDLRNEDGSRYGGVFAPSRIATCNLVIPAPVGQASVVQAP